MTFLIIGIFGLFILLSFIFKSNPVYVTLIINLGLFFSITLVFFIYIKKKKVSLKDIGFDFPKIKWILFALLLSFVVIALGGIASKFLAELLGLKSSGLESFKSITSDKMWLNILNFKLFFAILIPFAEEVYFRGIIFRYLRQENRFLASGIVSALIFSMIHFNPATIPFTFLLGFLSAYIYEKSNSIYAPFFVHMGVNSFSANLILFGIL